MNSCFIIIAWLLIISISITVSTTTEDPTNSCKWIYKCCEKVANKCVRMCDSEIICKDSANNNDENLEEVVEKQPTNLISPRTCRKGYRFVQDQCKKVF